MAFMAQNAIPNPTRNRIYCKIRATWDFFIYASTDYIPYISWNNSINYSSYSLLVWKDIIPPWSDEQGHQTQGMGTSLIDDGTLDANKPGRTDIASGRMSHFLSRRDREHHKSGALRKVTPTGV